MVEISCWSKLVVHKKHFYVYFAVFNNRERFFIEHSVSLSYESSCDNSILNRCCIYFKRALTGMNCIYTIYLIDISI